MGKNKAHHVEAIAEHIKRFAEYWALLGVVTAIIAGWFHYGNKHGRRLLRSLDLSDSLHHRFEHEKATDLADQIYTSHVDGAVREMRVALLERKLSAAVFVCDPISGSCTYANEELAELFGLDSTDFAGNGWLAAVDSEDRSAVWEKWQYAVKNHIPYECIYSVVSQRTGERFRCFAKAYPAKLRSGKVAWYVGTIERIDS